MLVEEKAGIAAELPRRLDEGVRQRPAAAAEARILTQHSQVDCHGETLATSVEVQCAPGC